MDSLPQHFTTFRPRRQSLGYLDLGEVRTETIKEEKSLFSAAPYFAYSYGGRLTRALLDYLQPRENLYNAILDTRVTMLMPGWYPSIPGWHMDEIVRDLDSNQPDIFAENTMTHYLVSVDVGTGSTTEFVNEPITIYPEDVHTALVNGQTVWEYVNRRISGSPRLIRQAASREVIRFGHGDFHKAVPAIGHGWRWFARLTVGSPRPILNEVRGQVQVYITDPDRGW